MDKVLWYSTCSLPFFSSLSLSPTHTHTHSASGQATDWTLLLLLLLFSLSFGCARVFWPNIYYAQPTKFVDSQSIFVLPKELAEFRQLYCVCFVNITITA